VLVCRHVDAVGGQGTWIQGTTSVYLSGKLKVSELGALPALWGMHRLHQHHER
jgi:hypothetical protein